MLSITAFLPKEVSIIKDSLLSSHFALISEKIARIVTKDMRHGFLVKIGAYKKAWKNKK